MTIYYSYIDTFLPDLSHIPKERVDETEQVFQKLGADVTKKIYKGMGHTVNQDEIDTVQEMIFNLK